jgi:hypothetical protein
VKGEKFESRSRRDFIVEVLFGVMGLHIGNLRAPFPEERKKPNIRKRKFVRTNKPLHFKGVLSPRNKSSNSLNFEIKLKKKLFTPNSEFEDNPFSCLFDIPFGV